MQGVAFMMRFSDNHGGTRHLLWQQDHGFETIRFDVTVHPSFGRVFKKYPDCQGIGVCDDVFALGPLGQVLLFAAELRNKI